MNHLFAAKGVAIVGAAEKRHYPSSILKNLLLLGYPKEQIYPINPKYKEIMGLPCYPSLNEISGKVELAVLITRRDTVPDLLMDAAQCGVKSVVVLADGFAEQGQEGRDMQLRIAAIAKENNLSLLGPNTLGFVMPSRGLGVWAGGQLAEKVRPGGVVLAFQSSGTLNLAFSLVCDRQIGIRAGVSVGNEAVVDIADIIDHFVQDSEANVIGVFLESSMRPEKLVDALLHAQKAGKPVIMLKVGRSERARRNAVAHTGRMASSGHAWEALLKRLGVILVEDLDELLETVVLFDHRKPITKDPGLGIVTISGGDCSMLSDLAERLDVTIPDVTPKTKQILVEALEKPALLGNPLDCESLRSEDPERFQRVIQAFCHDPSIHLVAYRMNLAKYPTPALLDMYRQLLKQTDEANKMAIILSRAIEPLDTAWYRFFEEQGVAFLPSYHTAMRAIHHLQTWIRRSSKNRTITAPQAIPQTVEVQEEEHTILDWEQTQEWLREASIPYAPVRLASSPEDAAHCAESLGFPVVVKLVSVLVPHKSEMNAVELNVKSAEDVHRTCQRMLSDFHQNYPDAAVEGFEVQSMISGGTEMILGMTTDPIVGPVLLVGAGGIFTEVLKDVVLAIPPVSMEEALELLDNLKFSAVLKGIRGKPPLDRAALASTISSFSHFVVDRKEEIREMDLNPIFVMAEGKGVMAVDALITIRKKGFR